MLDAARHDEELACVERHATIAKFHDEAAVDDEKQLVFVLVVMPHELALELHELDVLTVQLADDFRVPVGVKQRERVAKVDFTDLRHRTLTVRQKADPTTNALST